MCAAQESQIGLPAPMTHRDQGTAATHLYPPSSHPNTGGARSRWLWEYLKTRLYTLSISLSSILHTSPKTWFNMYFFYYEFARL